MKYDENSTLLPTTQIYDPSEIMELDVNSEEFKEFIVQLNQTQQDLLVNANLKPGGFYSQTIFLSGNQWYPNPNDPSNTNRTSLRLAIPTGALTNSGPVITIAHGIPNVNATNTWVILGGAATNNTSAPWQGIPIPYIGAKGYVSLDVDATNIYLQCSGNFAAYTTSQVYIEFILG